jgi:osmotically-inducible protein OsmY
MLRNSRIENDVRAALERDPRIKHPELITVTVDEIGTVVLRGAVESLPQRHAAAHDARQIDGVFDVIVDDLKVHPPVRPIRGDDEVRAAVMEQLNSDPRIRSTHISVTVMNGHVTLKGYVREESEYAAAAEDAASVIRVVGVTNQIEVRATKEAIGPPPAPRGPRAEDEIRAAVMQQMSADSRIRSTHIRVDVVDGHVTLKGYVGEQSEHAAAAEDAASVSGVAGVTNQLEIRATSAAIDAPHTRARGPRHNAR